MHRRRLSVFRALAGPVAAVFLSLPVGASSWAQGVDQASDEVAIRAQVTATAKAINARDFAALANLYANDGDAIVLSGPKASGPAAIRETSEAGWSGAPAARQITFTVEGIRFLGHDVAVVDATARFNAGEPTTTRPTYVLVRRNGHWLIAATRVLPAAN
jgi:uncharacterized protein (TIGR02246 family)